MAKVKNSFPFPTSLLLFLFLAGLFGSLAGCSSQKRSGDFPPQAIGDNQALAALLKTFFLDSPVSPPVKKWEKMLLSFYTQRTFRPYWVDETKGPLEEARSFMKTLEKAPENGLVRTDYFYDQLAGLQEIWKTLKNHPQEPYSRMAPTALRNLEILFSLSFLKYLKDLSMGKVNLRPFDGRPYLTELRDKSPQKILEEATPLYPSLHRLKEALHHYRLLEKSDSQDTLLLHPPGLPWKKGALPFGSWDKRLVLLRKKLSLLGDLGPVKKKGPPRTTLFDEELVLALKSFQGRHGMKETGEVDEKTLAALNVSVKSRVRQLELNLERWRWLPPSLGQKYIIVNIANFNLSVVEDKITMMSMKVIVGRPYRETPVFSGNLKSLTLNPPWTIPHSLIREDILPKVQKDLGYLKTQQIKIFRLVHGKKVEVPPEEIPWDTFSATQFDDSLILRQEPGPHNPLGRMIFHLPNKYSIYLHDTPTRGSFSQNSRNLSAGCIRLQHPLSLATYLLRDDPLWTREALEEAIKGGQTLKILLPEKVPVHLLYWTAWVTPNGAIHFRDDIYNRDSFLAKDFYPEETEGTPTNF